MKYQKFRRNISLRRKKVALDHKNTGKKVSHEQSLRLIQSWGERDERAAGRREGKRGERTKAWRTKWTRMGDKREGDGWATNKTSLFKRRIICVFVYQESTRGGVRGMNRRRGGLRERGAKWTRMVDERIGDGWVTNKTSLFKQRIICVFVYQEITEGGCLRSCVYVILCIQKKNSEGYKRKVVIKDRRRVIEGG